MLTASARFCLCGGAEVRCSLTLACALCGVRVCVSGFCPGDRVALCAQDGCDWCEHVLCGTGQAVFGFVRPGAYRLLVQAGGRRLCLRLHLPPGANLRLCCAPAQGRCGWAREWFFCRYNRD